jgi:hypothetical protein
MNSNTNRGYYNAAGNTNQYGMSTANNNISTSMSGNQQNLFHNNTTSSPPSQPTTSSHIYAALQQQQHHHLGFSNTSQYANFLTGNSSYTNVNNHAGMLLSFHEQQQPLFPTMNTLSSSNGTNRKGSSSSTGSNSSRLIQA